MKVILSIVRQVDEDIEILEKLVKRLKEILIDPIQRRALERSLHTAIEGMFDLLRHIVTRIAPGSFETYRELADVAEKLGIASITTSDMLKEFVDVRHTLVHRYRGITDELVKEYINKVRVIWPPFKEEVKDYLRKIGFRIK
jgi:uncharacterized protein YutE (UPF0331/DUF86 family)